MKKKIILAFTTAMVVLSSTNAFAATKNYARSKYANNSIDSLYNNYLNNLQIKFDKNGCLNNSDLSDYLNCYLNGTCDNIFSSCQNGNNCTGGSGCTGGNSCTGNNGNQNRPGNNDKPDIEEPDIEEPDIEEPDVEEPDVEEPDVEEPDTDIPDYEKPYTDKPGNNNRPDNNKPNTDNEQSGNTSESQYAAEVVRLVNAERAKEGLSALKSDSTVQSAAQVRAQEIVSTFSHTRPNGSSCFTALEAAGVRYSGAGENIAYGQKSPEDVVNAWMNSPGHRANIMNKNFTTIGVGCYKSGNTYYWSQFFTY